MTVIDELIQAMTCDAFGAQTTVDFYQARARCVRCNGFRGFESVCEREGCPMEGRYIKYPESWGCIFFAD